MACPLCNDSGIVASTSGGIRKCKCVLEKQLKVFIDPRLKTSKVITKNLEKRINKNIFLKKERKDSYDLLKTFIVSEFIRTNGDFTYRFMSVPDMLELVFSEDRFTSELEKPDLLFLDLHINQENKLLPAMYTQLVEARSSTGKMTWVYCTYTEAKIKEYFGTDFHKIITGLGFAQWGNK